MSPENYVELAKCTEPDSEKYKEIIDRCKGMIMFLEMFERLKDVVNLGHEVDKYKRAIFYGKPIDLDTNETVIDHFHEMRERVDEDFIRLLHSGMGLMTEAAEFIEALVEYLQTGELDKVNLAEELGDVCWYTAIGSDTTEVPLSQIMITNIEKLKKRFGDKFSEKEALIRDLESERDILDNGLGNN